MEHHEWIEKQIVLDLMSEGKVRYESRGMVVRWYLAHEQDELVKEH